MPQQTHAEWLAGLKVGDEVAVPAQWGSSYEICVLGGETPARWSVGSRRFRKADGQEIGGIGSSTRKRLSPVTPELREKKRREKALANLAASSEAWVLGKVPTSRIEAAVALLKGEQKT